MLDYRDSACITIISEIIYYGGGDIELSIQHESYYRITMGCKFAFAHSI